MSLSQAQIDHFHHQGYLVVEDVLPPAIINAVRAEYSALLDRLYAKWFADGLVSEPPATLGFWDKLLVSYKAGCDWFQPMDISLPGDQIAPDTPMHFGPAIFDLVVHERLLDVVECLLGPELTSNPIQHVRIKPPAPNLREGEIRAHVTATDWHQDRGVAHEQADQTDMVTVWVAITDATTDNGCLKVMPGLSDLLPHCAKTQTGIPEAFIDEDRAVPTPVKSGGVVLFHPLVPHASLPNGTDAFRWSFDLRFHKTGQPSGREHFPSFVARSRNAPDSELRDWLMWKEMWEAARARLSDQPHIPIHRWDSSAPHCA